MQFTGKALTLGAYHDLDPTSYAYAHNIGGTEKFLDETLFLIEGNLLRLLLWCNICKTYFLVRRDESPENYCHSPGVVGGVVVVVVVVRRQKL